MKKALLVIFMVMALVLNLCSCGKEITEAREAEIVDEIPNVEIVEEVIEDNVSNEDTAVYEKPAVSDEYLAELGYNTQTNEWGNR